MKNLLFSKKNFSNDFALLLLRLTAGGLMLKIHGINKIAKLSQDPVKFMDFMGLGPEISLWLVVFAEAGCSFLLMVGLATRLTLIPLIITMLVVIFKANAGEPLPEVELPLVFLVTYIALFITGPGKFSVDGMISK